MLELKEENRTNQHENQHFAISLFVQNLTWFGLTGFNPLTN